MSRAPRCQVSHCHDHSKIDGDAVAEADQEEDVHDGPQPPGEHAAEGAVVDVRDGAPATDRRQQALVAIVEGRAAGQTAAQIGVDEAGDEAAHLHGGGRDAGHLLAGALDMGQVADDEDLGMAGDRQVGCDLHASGVIERGAERLRERRGLHPRGPDHIARVDALASVA